MSGESVNDGDCPICGHLQDLINAGTIKPCCDWERIDESEEEDEDEPKSKRSRK